MNFLLSYPRSGSTWVRYIIEFFSGRPTEGMSPKDNYISKRIGDLETSGKPIIYKKHHMTANPHKEDEKLIVLIRNPVEAITRHRLGKIDAQQFWEDTSNVEAKIDYIFILGVFEKWKGPKLLVYYEDLMSDPKKQISRMLDFLDINQDKLDDFITNIDTHVNNGVSAYSSHDQGSVTKGKDSLHHSKKIGKHLSEFLLMYLRDRYPTIFGKYLSRYVID